MLASLYLVFFGLVFTSFFLRAGNKKYSELWVFRSTTNSKGYSPFDFPVGGGGGGGVSDFENGYPSSILVPKKIHAHDHCLKKVSLTFLMLKICYTEKEYHVHTSLLHERVE